MAVIHDYECKFCGSRFEAWSDATGCDFCGGMGEKRYNQLISWEWGGPRYDNALMKTFNSRSDKFKYLREKGLQLGPAADKYGGAYPNNIEAPRKSRMFFDPRTTSSRSKGTNRRLDEGR
jgi:hypothetical protein